MTVICVIVTVLAVLAALWQRTERNRFAYLLQNDRARLANLRTDFDTYAAIVRQERQQLHKDGQVWHERYTAAAKELDGKTVELDCKVFELRQAEQIMEKLTNQVADYIQKEIEGRTRTAAITQDNERLRKKLSRAETDLMDAQHLINRLEATLARRNQQLQNATNLALGYTYRATPALNPNSEGD